MNFGSYAWLKSGTFSASPCIMICLFRPRFCSSVQNLKNRSGTEKISYFHGLPEKPLLGATIGQLVDRVAENYPDRDAYVFCEDDKRATFQEFKTKVKIMLFASFIQFCTTLNAI